MKWIGILSVGVALGLAALACCLGYSGHFHAEAPSVTSEYSNLLFQDACVVQVTHPELKIELVRVETPRDGCNHCRYWFRVWNQTAAVGTKAYQTSVLVAPFNLGIELRGKTIEALKLQGFVTELPTIRYPVLKDQDWFVVEGLCPQCLFADQALIKLVLEYYECAGVRRYSCVCDLRSKQVTALYGSFEPLGTCCE